MKAISELLEKFKNFGFKEKESAAKFVESANFVLGGTVLNKENVVLKNGVIKIAAPSAIKAAIFLNKKKILDLAREKTGPSFLVKDVI